MLPAKGGGRSMESSSTSSQVGIARSTVAAMSWRILPLFGIGYLFALMDRTNVSFAALQMNQELGFSATVYGLGAGMFYLAYALFEVPSNLLLARVGARRWLARIMVTWGIIAAGMMFVATPFQFYVMRFLLGMAEAGFFPGIVFYLAQWFPSAERGRAISRFYFFGPLSAMVMGGLSAWLLGLHGAAGLHGWQWLFLVQGLPAALVGVAFLLWLPDSPRSVDWLTSAQCEWIERELAADAARIGTPQPHNVLAALRHPMVLQFGLLGMLTIGATVAYTLAAPLLLKESGFATGSIGALTSFGGLLGAIGMLVTGWVSDRRGERFTTMIIGSAVMGLAFAVMALVPSPMVIMVGTVAFGASWGVVTLSQVSAWPEILHGPMLGVGCAAINTLSQVGAFVMPLAWGRSRDLTGGASLGLLGLTAVMTLALVLTFSLRAQLRRSTAPARVALPALG